MLPTPRSARVRTGRCYLPTPALTRTGSGAEGLEILREIGGAAGVLVWGTLRDVMLYLSVPSAGRAGLFPRGAGEARREEIRDARVDPALWAPLLVVAEMMEDPERASRARVAHACRAIARWTDGQAPCTRLAFAQAAAMARPGDPRLALATARLARDRADHGRAESWFRRAVRLARGKDWESYVRAFLGLGVMYHRGGNNPAAHAVVGRALRAARRRRLVALQGEAHHELFIFATDSSRIRDAHTHAAAALAAYGSQHPRLPHLAHDVGCFWSEQGRFDLARPIFEQLLPCFSDVGVQVRVLANLTRAAAGVGAREQYEASRARAFALLKQAPEFEGEVLVLIALGDNMLREWDRAEAAAARGLAAAVARGASETRLIAEAQLELARRRRTAAVVENGSPAREASQLAFELGRSLQQRTPELFAGAA